MCQVFCYSVLKYSDNDIYSMNMTPILRRVLRELGLSDKEGLVMETLLENGPMLASRIAKETKLNRTTVYGLLKDLVESGLVSSSDKGALRFESIDPELLPAYIERRREALADSKSDVEAIVPQIKLLRNKGRVLPKVRYFEGRRGVEQAREDTLENNPEKRLYEITGIDAVYTKLDPKFVKYYTEKRARMGIKSFYLAPKTQGALKAREDDKKYLREVTFLPAELSFDTEISIYGDRVGIFSYVPETPIALIIEDTAIAQTMKKIFEYMRGLGHKNA